MHQIEQHAQDLVGSAASLARAAANAPATFLRRFQREIEVTDMRLEGAP
jgi:hypothetical protein